MYKPMSHVSRPFFCASSNTNRSRSVDPGAYCLVLLLYRYMQILQDPAFEVSTLIQVMEPGCRELCVAPFVCVCVGGGGCSTQKWSQSWLLVPKPGCVSFLYSLDPKLRDRAFKVFNLDPISGCSQCVGLGVLSVTYNV